MQQRFAAEIGRRLGQPGYRPQVVHDPIAHWIDQDCWRPPSLPIHDYRGQRTFGGPSYRKPQQRNEEARFTSAARFAQHRCGGDAMLHHRSLAPVILRDWARSNALFESALSATATVSEPRAERASDASWRVARSFDYIRTGPAPTDYLDTAVEPAPWPERTEPREQGKPRPWSVSERPYFTPSPRRRRQFKFG
ncbi:hypothetical protein [Nocardia sp. NPDC052112]|uniref:hypothetical protein n=1 Tax=Nocardia sp. NPDC052112 TaxID=3155646 RepID=UPI0034460DC1